MMIIVENFTGQEQLTKAREIIKRLQEEKKKLTDEIKTQVEVTEKVSDEERDKLVQELKRAKAAALELMQVKLLHILFACCISRKGVVSVVETHVGIRTCAFCCLHWTVQTNFSQNSCCFACHIERCRGAESFGVKTLLEG